MNPAPALKIRGLYAITPDTPDTARLLLGVERALLGGAGVVQYRNKSKDAALRLEQATGVRALCAAHDAVCIVNDDARLALAVDADGVHAGAEDGDLAEIRALLGPGRLLGATCYNDLANADRALAAGADHVAFGSFYPSSTKPLARPATLPLLAEARRRFDVPIVAIGGITLDNAPPLIEAGADAVAVISALFGAGDIEAAARAFAGLFPPGA